MAVSYLISLHVSPNLLPNIPQSRLTVPSTTSSSMPQVNRFGRKTLYIYGFVSVPIRGVLCAMYPEVTWLMLCTQILDGVGAGVCGVMKQVVTQDLSRGTGRFNVALGVTSTSEMAGGAISNLVAEVGKDY